MTLSISSAVLSEVTRTCKQVMNQHRQTLSLVASNRSVVADNELNFDQIDNCVEPINHTKAFDAVVFDVLRVPAEDIANQLTLIDLPLFQDIGPEELTCCAWTAKKKHELCPNVVKFTKRFNQVSFWVSSEILGSNTAKNRAEKVIHFIKIAKKLLELNNLNCLKAVVSGLQSAPIYRLSKTWNVVPKRDKEKLEKLNDLVSEDNNRTKIRTYLQHARLPCIPYLGMYLTDLTYINTIHPCTGGLDVERTDKMNEILRIIADFQQSSYEFDVVSHIRKYLSSVKYIDELQKFMEDDNYKLSLQIEPTAQHFGDRGYKESHSVSEFGTDSDELFPSNLRKSLPSKSMSSRPSARLVPKSSSLNLPGPFRSPSPDKKQFVLSHRKVKSLGSHQQFLTSVQPNSSTSASLSAPSESRYHLVDDSLVDDSQHEVSTSNSYDSGLDHDEPETHPIIQSAAPKKDDILTPSLPWAFFKLQGFLKRKTLLKNGTRPKVASWQRFWVGITCSTANIVYFLPKYRGFGGHDRIHFKADPHKVVPLLGSTVFISSESDSFQVTEESGDSVYRFRAGSQINANLWYEAIREATDGAKLKLPKNLITFDDDEGDTRL